MFKFEIIKESKKTKARLGKVTTAHGTFTTPCFMPCATKAAVKTVDPTDLTNLGYEIILSNTYHLYLRPGLSVLKKTAGLHKFMRWNGPILTDSGGFQVFSLRRKKDDENGEPLVKKISSEGVIFRSHIDGSLHKFTPEKVIDIQQAIGSDIMMVLDECTEYPVSALRAQRSMELSNLWAKRSIDYWQKKKIVNQALFGIIQGSTYKNLREKAAKYITSLPFNGYAIGGVSVGENKKEMFQVVDWVEPFLSQDKPRYLMGVGEPADIIKAINAGIDMFDCVLPTRLARHGVVWTGLNTMKFGRLDLRKAAAKNDTKTIEHGCGCYTCQKGFSRAYLAHLIREKEVLGIRLATIHNLYFINQLMDKIRRAI